MVGTLPTKSYSQIPVKLPLPNLIEVQLNSFVRLKAVGLGDLFHEISPIESYNKGMRLYFPSRTPESEQWGLTYWFDEPKILSCGFPYVVDKLFAYQIVNTLKTIIYQKQFVVLHSTKTIKTFEGYPDDDPDDEYDKKEKIKLSNVHILNISWKPL